ncbi:MAG: hypothetical protein QM757_22160 [Paludibaculum sp.]
MDFLWGGGGRERRWLCCLVPGIPRLRAHLAMAEAALAWAEEAVLVLPRAFPHKSPDGAALEQRAVWLVALAATRPGLAVAWSDGGLFIEMAREARRALSARRVLLVCGRDAAERIVGWDYGVEDSIERHFGGSTNCWWRRGRLPIKPPAQLAGRVHALHLGDGWHEVSSSEARARIAAGRAWESLVPAEIRESVRGAY